MLVVAGLKSIEMVEEFYSADGQVAESFDFSKFTDNFIAQIKQTGDFAQSSSSKETISESLRIEAEIADNVNNYRTEYINGAGGGQALSLLHGSGNEVGKAFYDFEGESGRYNIDLGVYDESDGSGAYRVFVNNVAVGQHVWTDKDLGSSSANSQTATEIRGGTDVLLNRGDIIQVEAWERDWEHARLDYLDLERIGTSSQSTVESQSELEPEPEPVFESEPISSNKTFKVQAEDLLLENYRIDSVKSAEGGKVASLAWQSVGEVGEATYRFTGEEGKYDINLGVYDENDGEARFTIEHNDINIGSVVLDFDLGHYAPNPETFRNVGIADDIYLRQGDLVSVSAFEDAGDHARFDYLEFAATL